MKNDWVDRLNYDAIKSFHRHRKNIPIKARMGFMIDMAESKWGKKLKTSYEIRRMKKRKPHTMCKICEFWKAYCFHHIILLKNGGPDASWNRIPVCMVCHKEIHGWITFQ